MNCRDFVHRYSDYDDSLLDAVELESFRAHLAGCASCTRYDRVLRKGRMLARHHTTVAPGEDFLPRLQNRLWQQRIERRRRLATTVPGGPAAALAAVTVVLTSLWAVSLLDPTDPISPVADASAPEAVDWAGTALTTGASASLTWRTVPVAEGTVPREWGVRRVDPRGPVAYSPLVTGPPAYRVQHAFQASATMSTGRTLD